MLLILISLFLLNKNNKKYKTSFFFDSKNAEMSVHFIDVGKADSILILHKDISILIDAGDIKPEGKVVSYINSQNVKKLNYLFLTHPHQDHYGQMKDVIRNFEVDKFITTSEIEDCNDRGYISLLQEIKKRNIKFEAVKMGMSYISNNINIYVVSPMKKYKNVNDNSLVLLLSYKNIKILFTGDAQKNAERDILKNHKNLSADVLKIGHHGSNTSTSFDFLKLVNPTYSIISTGDHGNKFNIYPSKKVLERLNKIGTVVYSTKNKGNIIMIYINNSIQFLFEKDNYNLGEIA